MTETRSTTQVHQPSVRYLPGTRYPWLPECTCGAHFRGYAAEHAARIMAEAVDAHRPPR